MRHATLNLLVPWPRNSRLATDISSFPNLHVTTWMIGPVTSLLYKFIDFPQNSTERTVTLVSVREPQPGFDRNLTLLSG